MRSLFMCFVAIAAATVPYDVVRKVDKPVKLFKNPGASGACELYGHLGLGLWQKHSRRVRGQLNKTVIVPNTILEIGSSATSSYAADPDAERKQLIYEQEVSLAFGLVFLLFVFVLWSWVLATKKGTHKSALYSMLSPHSHRPQAVGFRWFIAALVLFNIAMLLMDSDPVLGKKYKLQFDMVEAMSSYIFLIEYCMRLYVIPQSKQYSKLHSNLRARLQWMTTFESVLDLLAFLPWFIEAFVNILFPLHVQLPNLTWLRVFRLFRLMKIGFVSESLDVFARVIYYNSEILIVSMILCAVLVLLLSILLYYMAPRDAASQEEDYSSVMACMFLSIMMLTGQGNPEGELPWYTKLVVCITCVFAVGLFAIQASMLTWGFENEAARRVIKQKKEKQEKARALMMGKETNNQESSSSDDEIESDWEEYEANIAGSDPELDDDDDAGFAKDGEPAQLKLFQDELTAKQYDCLKKIFKYLDYDDDETIKKEELQRIPDLGADALFDKIDANKNDSIEISEFVRWILTIKKTQPPDVFKLFLSDLAIACKEGKKEEQAGDLHQRIANLDKLSSTLKELLAENEKLKKDTLKLQKENSLLKAATQVHTKAKALAHSASNPGTPRGSAEV